MQSTQTVQPTQPIQSNQTVQSTQPMQPTQTVQPTQPIQSTQPVQPTQNLNNKLEIINPLNPDEILKTEILVEKKETAETIETDKKNDKMKDKKKKLPLLLIILILILITIGVVLYFTLFRKEEKPIKNPQVEVPEVEKITLNDILNNFNNSDNIAILRQQYNIIGYVENNKLIISVNEGNNEPVLYEFYQNNRTLTFNYNKDDQLARKISIIIIDNIGQFNGLEKNEVYNYISSIDLTISTVDGVEMIDNGETYQLNIDLDKKIDISNLETMYIDINDLKNYEDFLKNAGTFSLMKGNLLFYKQGDDKTTTITIGEKDNSSTLTYNSILSVIEMLYPNELETFKVKYPQLATISFDRYIITLNPELTGEVASQFGIYQNNYKFIEIKINKS